MNVAIVTFGAVSGLGRGAAACSAGEAGAPPRVAIARDVLLEARGLTRPFGARVRHEGTIPLPASALFERALADCVQSMDEVAPAWRTLRVGLALGTSSGSQLSREDVFAALETGAPLDARAAREATYFHSAEQVPRLLGKTLAPFTLVLTACAASTVAIGIGARWLEAGHCDVVLAGGFDELSTFVASGFEVLRATTASTPPRPFCKSRDGMSLGEGAGLIALMRAPEAPRALAYVRGFAASADAVHLTAPDRTGAGLARAATAALRDAQIAGAAIDVVSNHATATPFNDAAEANALRATLGEPARPVLFGFKAQIGHTLGAAGVLETLASVDAIARGILPGAPVAEDVEPDLPGRLLARAEKHAVEHALKLSAAFGGANAALVLSRSAVASGATARTPREVWISRAVMREAAPSVADLAAQLGVPAEKLARTDRLVRLCLGACADLAARESIAQGAGVVVGHSLATLETNTSFAARLRERGARAVEPRKFPYTSPNAVAGECGATFGWTGPGIAVGGGLHGPLEAFAVACDLIRAGDADCLIVVGVDEVGEVGARWLSAALGRRDALSEGAVAFVVSAAPVDSGARVTGVRTGLVSLSPDTHVGDDAGERLGHAALAPLACEASPSRLVSRCPFGGFAEIDLTWPSPNG